MVARQVSLLLLRVYLWTTFTHETDLYVEARSIGNVDGSLSNTHINLFKRMETIASGQNHNTRFVTPAYFSDLIEANSGSLGLYLKYSKEARDRVGELDEEDPYVSRLRQIAREYSWSVEENIQLDIIPWQKFINAQLLANLQRPWSEQWEMPIDGLTAIERIEGLSEAAFLKYPTAEITNEDEFDQSGPLLDEQVSTYDYIREFTVPFDSIYELADWIFTPTYAPASIATATDEGSLSINLLRRRRIKASLETIYYKLRGIISRLQDPGTKVLGEIKTPWLEAAYADELGNDVGRIVESWERVQDIIGVMATIMSKLEVDPPMPGINPIESVDSI